MENSSMHPRAVIGMDSMGLLMVENGEGGIDKMKLSVIAGGGLKVTPVPATDSRPDQLQERKKLVRHAGVDQLQR